MSEAKANPRALIEERNLATWCRVWQTDPKHTRHVNQRGGFTAINAMYLVGEATREFGRCGEGWGWEYEPGHPRLQEVQGEQVWIVRLRIWYVAENGERVQGFPVLATHPMTAKGRIDDDAGKKAQTDAITKGLSYLGFGADIHLGLWDDNKYAEGGR